MISDSFSVGAGLGLALESSDPAAIRFYRQEYSWAERRAQREGVTLAWRRRKLPRFHPDDGHFHAHKLLARWRYRIEPGHKEVSIEAGGNRWALPMVHHMLVHPSLRLLAARRGQILLHGAALVHKGRTVVMTGAGGSGKTTTSSILLAHGSPDWKLHADDYVFLSPSGKTRAYLTRSHLYLDLFDHLPGLWSRLSGSQQRRLQFFGRLRRWSRDGITWPVRIRQDRLWPQRQPAEQGELGAIFLLRRSKEGGPRAVKIQTREQAVRMLLDMNFHEARHFQTLMAKVRGQLKMKEMKERWAEAEGVVLRQLVSQFPLFHLDLPAGRRADPELAGELETTLLASLEEEVPATP